MFKLNVLEGTALGLVLLLLACAAVRQTPQPAPSQQLAFEIQTATPTISLLLDAPTNTPDPNATPTLTATLSLSATVAVTITGEATAQAAATAPVPDTPPAPEPEEAAPPPPTAPPAPAGPLAEPLQGGEWDFEAGFESWRNPYGDSCDGSGLAVGWSAFTTQDQYGSSCMNQTNWPGNVYSGDSAQEITFAYVGNQAGIFKSAPTTPGHRYTVEAFMKREFSPAKLEVSLGLDPTGGTNWEAETVQWFPWDEDIDDAYARTEETITAGSELMTVFIKGAHPYPEPGGILRIDSIRVVDEGP